MADGTKIEWTDATWNPVTGCSRVSTGCENCYAERLAGGRLRNHPSRSGLTRETSHGPVWNGKVRFNGEWLDQPLHWRRPRRIFVCAHGDLFHEDVPPEWIDAVYEVMAAAPQHVFQVVTKRPHRMRRYILDVARAPSAERERVFPEWPLPNVWALTSAENHAAFTIRVPELLETPAAVRGVSVEPMLAPVAPRGLELRWVGSSLYFLDALTGDEHFAHGTFTAPSSRRLSGLDWVIVGGESGPGARPMDPDWARSLRDQCRDAGVPFFLKQMSRREPIPADLMIREFPA